jgi:hypothetical protein
MSTKDHLLQNIYTVFKNSSKPDKNNIVRGESLEAKMIKYYLAPRTWQEVDVQVLSNYDQRADLSAMTAFLSSEGLRYYLPSFMVFVVLQNKKAGLLIYALLSRLASPERISASDFSQSQSAVVIWFLQYLKENYSNDADMCEEIDLALTAWV